MCSFYGQKKESDEEGSTSGRSLWSIALSFSLSLSENESRHDSHSQFTSKVQQADPWFPFLLKLINENHQVTSSIVVGITKTYKTINIKEIGSFLTYLDWVKMDTSTLNSQENLLIEIFFNNTF